MKQIHTQREFNEALRVNRDAKIFLTPGGAVPNIWVDTKSRSEKVISTTSVAPDTSIVLVSRSWYQLGKNPLIPVVAKITLWDVLMLGYLVRGL